MFRILNQNSQWFLHRFILDPLSIDILSAIPRYHKLEVFLMATTLLRYCDVKKLNLPDFLNGKEQIIQQGKTKTKITIPSLFLSQSSLTASELPVVSLFTDSYDKIRYSLKHSISYAIRKQLRTQRTVTHIFRFLRASYYYLTLKDFYLASKYLGHKDPESVRSYVPPELLNIYSQYLSKG